MPTSYNPGVSYGEIFGGANVLVTGGLGFIGSALARKLVEAQAKVTLVDSLIPEYGGNLFNIHDIRDRVTVDLTDVRDSTAMASLVKNRQFLFNLAGEWYHLLYNDVYQIRACALRLTNTYGPGMRVKDARQTFLGIWIRRLIEEKDFQVFGDGKQRRDFNFVGDVVDALLLAASSDDANGQVFNLGDNEHITLQELASLLIKLSGTGKYELVPFPGDRKAIDIGDYFADFRKIQRLLGWTPKTKLEDGLTKTLRYYHDHHAHYWD